MRRETLGYFAVLILAGAGWGMTQPLTKIAVSTGHRPLGLVFWQQVLVLLALGSLTLARGKRLPLAPRYLWRYGLISLLGTVIPNAVSYSAAVHLPSGFLSIIISLVPMFSLPLALAAGLEHFSLLRLTGLVCGAVAITLLATPDANFSDPSAAKWVLIAAIAPLMYALEGTWVAKYGILDLDVMQLVLGASLAGLVMAAPFAVLSGQWIDPTLPWGRAEWALVMSALVHAFVYSGYVWLIGRAGSVFASQVSYLVTGFGVFWAMLILQESYGAWVWGALAVMMIGLFLVQPHGRERLAALQARGDNETGS